MMKNKQGGTVAVECAFFALLLGGLLLVMVEGSNAIHTYSKLLDASREGARQVLREDGDTSEVSNLVQSLTADMAHPCQTSVSTNSANKTVTVEVSYEYDWFLWSGQGDSYFAAYKDDPLVLRATTTMPLP